MKVDGWTDSGPLSTASPRSDAQATGSREASTSPVSSVRNRAVVRAMALHRRKERRRRGETLVEGTNLLEAAFRAGAGVDVVFVLDGDVHTTRLCADQGVRLMVVTSQVMDRLAPTIHPQGPVAVIAIPGSSPLVTADTVALIGVTDPGNGGTMIRTAVAFGFSVAVTPDTTDPWSPKALRAGVGGQFFAGLSAVAADPTAEFHAGGLRTVAAVSSGGGWPPARSTGPRALLIGSESHGLPSGVVESADERITIPTGDPMESLNAAVAGAIIMYEIATTRSSS